MSSMLQRAAISMLLLSCAQLAVGASLSDAMVYRGSKSSPSGLSEPPKNVQRRAEVIAPLYALTTQPGDEWVRSSNRIERGLYSDCAFALGILPRAIVSSGSLQHYYSRLAMQWSGVEYLSVDITQNWDPVNIRWADAYSPSPEMFRGQLSARSERLLETMWNYYVNRAQFMRVAVSRAEQNAQSFDAQGHTALEQFVALAFSLNLYQTQKLEQCMPTFVRRMAELAEIYIPDRLRAQSEMELLQ